MTKNRIPRRSGRFPSPEAALVSSLYSETRSLVGRLALKYADTIDEIPRPGNQPLPVSTLWCVPFAGRMHKISQFNVTQYTPTFRLTHAPNYNLDYTAMWSEKVIDESIFRIASHTLGVPLRRTRRADTCVALLGDILDGQFKRQIKLGISSMGFASIDTCVVPNDEFVKPRPLLLRSRSITTSRVAWDYGLSPDCPPSDFKPNDKRLISPECLVAQNAREMLRITAAIGACLPIVAPDSRPEMERIVELTHAWDMPSLADCPPPSRLDSTRLQIYES